MRVLVLGGSGMLGHRVVMELAAAGMEVHATVRRPVPAPFRPAGATWHEGVDLGQGGLAALEALVHRLRPAVIVNTAGAIKQRDLASAVAETWYLNGLLPHAVALLASGVGARLITVSTDCVFDGSRGGYTERDAPDVEDLYGRSKAVGEVGYGAHLTLRTSIVGFELQGHLGLFSWLFSQRLGSELRGYRLARYSGVTTGYLSRVIIAQIMAPVPLRGLWQVAAEPISKLNLLRQVTEKFTLGHTFAPDDRVRIDRTLNDGRFREATASDRPDWDALLSDLAEDWVRWPYAAIYHELRSSTTASSA